MSQLVAVQVTTVATVVLAVGAIVTGVFAFLAFRAQRQQLQATLDDNARQAGVMALQADELRESLEERKRDREQRRKAQAARVLVWEEANETPEGVTGGVRNSSEQPVYGVVFIWSFGTDRVSYGEVGTVMPGEQKERGPGSLDMDLARNRGLGPLSPSAYFRDAARVYWYIQADGNLREAQIEELRAYFPSGWVYSGPVETHNYVGPND
jgi:hypothetical protein